MASNGHHHGGRSILVLYRIANSDSDNTDPHFNCFRMPFGRGPTLSSVKQHCAAAHSLSHLGPEGYHWRVMVEDKPGATGVEKTFSWWDIQDGNAKLPVKECTQYELRKLLFPVASTTDTATKAAKGAFKMMNKMASAVTGEDMGENLGPPVAVLTFKLLDLVKIHDDFAGKEIVRPEPAPSRPRPAPASAPPPRAQQQPRRQPAPAPVPGPARHHQPPPQRPAQQRPQHVPQNRRPAPTPVPAPRQEANLMDFGVTSATPSVNPKVLNHSFSSPPSAGGRPGESRPERLRREMAKKQQNMNRVWDDIDQRWVEAKPGPSTGKPAGVPGAPKAKVVGIKLNGAVDSSKSDKVKQGVQGRLDELKAQQEKALKEVREREAKKKQEEDAEDVARRQLEPKIKKWSEEHGKKKQLRALLGSLHTILWPGAKWKPVSIGDILDDSKVKRSFHKATLVVHPDKTHHLPPDQKFLAKRIFDALCQAKTEFDNGAK